jgi:spore coat polysaccharide biosynthesis predicted glycosyltransferase SpsG
VGHVLSSKQRAIRLVVASGPGIGQGHLARALALAEAGWGAGVDITLEFLEGTTTPSQLGRLEAAGGRLVPADVPLRPDEIVIVDLPDPNDIGQRFAGNPVAVFDDRGAFRGTADLVIQPSMPAWHGSAAAPQVLAGFAFAPIARSIRAYRTTPRPKTRGAAPRVLVCFGGADPDRVTERLLPTLARGIDAELEVIVGSDYAGPIDGWPIVPVRDPADFVARLARSDVVIISAGTMKFEAACLGRAMVLLAAADDQRPVGPAFAATGAAQYLGDGREIDPLVVARAAMRLVVDDRARDLLGMTAAELVDGAGGDRIAAAVTGLGQPSGSS